ncbi:hypothetical protein B0T26DRAFT_718172 [Lasiosphaeria miniovina]|uniref:Nephrocystin 3-like N-terminal domain-containing protein n=1 Tax=Lasiosphaeria miniovina TaxID=1954250 RepID=A0AA40DUD3_9PEZI|nr:uncharacterized protein B0T26DRAFT_718172 [Lasiosphaeria miniovina]KAK0713722.1 hypothetical protein B0T26DRAFT_718172 [Lasiosphaeria miniovina]
MEVYLAELFRHKDTMTLALGADSMAAIAKCLSRQDEINRPMTSIQGLLQRNMEVSTRIDLDFHRKKVLSSFLLVNPQDNLRTRLKLWHPLTGLWLTEGPIFKQWLDVPNSKLWLCGIPGGGKTILAGAMIESVLKRETSSTAIAFFFCDYADPRSGDPANILGALAS